MVTIRDDLNLDTGDYLAATFREESATFVGDTLYVAYENSILAYEDNEHESARLHALCLFDISDIFEAFDTISSCEYLEHVSSNRSAPPIVLAMT